MEHFRFSTSEVEPDEALEYWAEAVLPQLEASFLNGERRGFSCSLVGRRRAEIAIGNVALASYSGVWKENARMIGCADSARIFRIHAGQACFKDRTGAEWLVKAGEVFIAGPEALVSYEIAANSSGGLALTADMTTIPLRQLQKYGAVLSRGMAQHLSANPRSILFNHYVDALRSDQTSDNDFKRLIHNFTELTAITLQGEIDVSKSIPSLDAIFERSTRIISEHFRDGNFNAVAAAKLLKLSERALFKSFSLRESSFHEALTTQRLIFAARRLRSSLKTNVTTVAYESGFESISTFNRNFRAKFGMSPSAYRDAINTMTP